MALLFDNASTEYLQISSVLGLTGWSITISAWFYHDEATLQCAVNLADGGVDTKQINLHIENTHAVFATRVNGGSVGTATTSTTGTINTWGHACGVYASNTSMTAYLNGGGAVESTVNVTWPLGSTPRTAIGRRSIASPDLYFSGRLAEVAIWNVALDASEVAALAKGFSPLLIRPSALVAYWPLNRNSVNISTTSLDRWKSRFDLTEVNTPVIADHTRVIYPG